MSDDIKKAAEALIIDIGSSLPPNFDAVGIPMIKQVARAYLAQCEREEKMMEALKIIKRWRTTSVAESTIDAAIKAIEEGR